MIINDRRKNLPRKLKMRTLIGTEMRVCGTWGGGEILSAYWLIFNIFVSS